MKETVISFISDGISLEGALRLPDHVERPVPSVLLIHGSLEHDRDGNLLKTRDDRKVHRKGFFLEISRRFCDCGYATFAWDRRGFGRSHGSPGDYFSDVEDARTALEMMAARSELDSERIAVFGQSAGVFGATLLAKESDLPALYILSGGLFSDYKDMMRFNYHRARDYARQSPENMEWVEKNDPWGLALGLNLDEMFRAIEAGRDEFTIEYKNMSWNLSLDKRIYSDEFAPKNQFRFINRPTLVIHGENDLNVPPQDAFGIVRVLKDNNIDVELVMIPEADHSFQQSVSDYEIRLKERMALTSFKRPYKEEFFRVMIDFLNRKFAVCI